MYTPHATATPSSQLPCSLPGSKSPSSFSFQRSKLPCQLLIHRGLLFVCLFVFSPLPLLRKYWLITSGKLRPGSSTTLFTILQPPSSPLHTHSFNKSPSPLCPQTKSLLLPWQQQLRWLSSGPIFLFTVWKSDFLSRCQVPTSRLILLVGRIQSLAVVGLGIPLPGWLPDRGPSQLLDTDHLCATWSSPSPSQQEGLQSFRWPRRTRQPTTVAQAKNLAIFLNSFFPFKSIQFYLHICIEGIHLAPSHCHHSGPSSHHLSLDILQQHNDSPCLPTIQSP